jgi:hypothetical protein
MDEGCMVDGCMVDGCMVDGCMDVGSILFMIQYTNSIPFFVFIYYNRVYS